MYLTRMRVNARRRGAAKLLASRQAMHAAVLAGFPDADPTPAGRVLWRLDPMGETMSLVISSPNAPDLTHLVEQAGWPTLGTGWESRDYARLLNRIKEGQRWAFRLVANPTHALPPEPGAKRGRVVAHRTVAHQIGWLEQQAAKHGFTLVEGDTAVTDAMGGSPRSNRMPTARVARSDVQRFERQKRSMTLRVTEFDGLLEVRDDDALRRALTLGIGPAKAFGCGMLTLAPIGR
ncbi:type I-E CRISPR-associated protein Cas6/Cse3/CasE [Leucobacter allii]|uniref:type I-E CRISPR-associated protein Cas6/Cse3/CasE n=1 Tax=Leucobacter allii TaxID=2932247 RepID=UPI001FD32CEF|nr:type I-E CRISPR-associated protein Cas6/Cse3/CasE [Leucobacter allii]UOR01729.1 type I-E CRISPR-associated protein Cas6/Cse3/CasE [Leucobacter allii]